MKIAILVSRLLLGIVFFGFGLNGVLHLKAAPPMTPGDAASFITILMTHNYMNFVALLMVIAGLLLLVGRFVPLALVILGPILVNILLFHLLLLREDAALPLALIAVEVFLIFAYRLSFRGLFDAAPEVI
jgi:putative oxidoreductase